MIATNRSLIIKGTLLSLILVYILTYVVHRSGQATAWRSFIIGGSHLPPGNGTTSQDDDQDGTTVQAQIKFWRSFEPLLSSNPPNCPSPEREHDAKATGFYANFDIPRPNLTYMADEDIESMRRSHVNLVEGISSTTPRMAYSPGTRGVVTTAGGDYLPVLIISLRMLRRTGSILPMEVFLASSAEYEGNICTDVLPALNARCIILSDILDAVPTSQPITHYQLKSFAMLFSSFEELLFLDADSFPIHAPEELFNSQLFAAFGMITWPDFWTSTASHIYYTISGQPTAPMSKRQSSEAGQLLLSKKKHRRSLLLAAYYNYYGPSHYYPLLSQGAPGEGDKETFGAAADSLGEAFYATSEKVRPIGVEKEHGGIAGSAMVQFDPLEDYNLTRQGLWRTKEPNVAPSPRSFFVHANFPKFNPGTIFEDGGPTRDENGNDRRAWQVGEETIQSFGLDLEKRFWEEIKWTACELEHQFRSWRLKERVCERVKQYWMNVFATPRERILGHHEAPAR